MTKYMEDSQYEESLILADEISKLFKGRNVTICAIATSICFVATLRQYHPEFLSSKTKLWGYIEIVKELFSGNISKER